MPQPVLGLPDVLLTYKNQYLRYIKAEVRERRILCLDPGETMGWCVFENGFLCNCGQLSIVKAHNRWDMLSTFFKNAAPTHCVIENYVVYAHKLSSHAWSELYTAKLIGALNLICEKEGIAQTMQMAAEAKFFGTDTKLKTWGLFQAHFKHANDSIRHGLYYMLKCSQTGRSR